MSILKYPHQNANESDLERPLSPEDLTTEITTLNQKHAFVMHSGRAVIMTFKRDPHTGHDAITYSSQADFRALYANRQTMVLNGYGPSQLKPLADVWLTHHKRRQYDGLVFMPGSPMEVDGHYNLFRGWAAEPKPGDCSLFWAHVRENICAGNIEHFNYVQRWMAQAVQQPEVMPGVALVLRSPPGCGKGKLAYWFGQLFGEHYLAVSNSEQLFGKFNAHLGRAVLVFADEITWGGSKQHEGQLKAMITESEQIIELKGHDAIRARNYRRFIFASNEDWPVAMGPHDRRFFVLDVAPNNQQDYAYFSAIDRQMHNGGLNALMHDLLRTNLEDFNPRNKPAAGRGAYDIMERSLCSTGKFWLEYLRMFDLSDEWPLVLNKRAFHDQYLDWSKKNQKGHPEGLSEFAKKMHKMSGCENSSTRVNSHSVHSFNVSTPQRIQQWKMPSLDDARSRFEQYLGVGTDFWG